MPPSLASSWDAFLASSPRGQFQQSSGWAGVKSQEGWSAARVFVESDSAWMGGFQLLWKPMRGGRVGYISKGPVLAEESPGAVDGVLARVASVARDLRVKVLVLQPPDESAIDSAAMIRAGFLASPLASVISTTAIVSLQGGVDAVVSRMSRRARQNWQTASRRGAMLSWGIPHDIPRFFELMCASAARQRSRPNPSRAGLLQAMWDALPGQIRLAFAEYGGRRIAGVLLVAQRDRIVFWKKGWDGSEPAMFLNHFVMAECLRWACDAGFREADMAGMDGVLAARVVAGLPLSEAGNHSRDLFNLRFGARPKNLPRAHLLVGSPVLRPLVRAAMAWSPARRVIERRLT